METLTNASPIAIASNTVLAIAIVWIIWQLFVLRQAATQGSSIFPAMIPAVFIFAGAITTVELLHLSPLHLIWLFIVSFLLGLVAIMVPPVQSLSMGFFTLLAMTATASANAENTDVPESSKPSSKVKPSDKPSKKSTKGFGI